MLVINWIITNMRGSRGPQPNDRSRAAWEAFRRWCKARGHPSPSTDLVTLYAYSQDLEDNQGTKPRVLDRMLQDLALALEARGLPNPLKARPPAEAREGRLPILRKALSRSGTPQSEARAGLPEVRGPSSEAPATTVELLKEVPEEDLWLEGQRSKETRRAYRADIRHFISALRIRSRDELRLVDRAAVIHWQRAMEKEGARPRTIRRRLSALSSLFTHLVSQRLADTNPCREVKRPRVNRKRGETRSFSQKQARALLDAPDATTLRGQRDRAILSVGLQVGARRSEIAHLAVKDFHQNQGFWSLHFLRKGGEDLSVSVNPQTAQRIHDYLGMAGHAGDLEGPLFRPLRANGQTKDTRRPMHPDMIDRIVKKYARKLRFGPGFSAHSMRATFITTALDNGASLEDVQRDVGHADPTTTKLYDRRGHNPEKSASFFANY